MNRNSLQKVAGMIESTCRLLPSNKFEGSRISTRLFPKFCSFFLNQPPDNFLCFQCHLPTRHWSVKLGNKLQITSYSSPVINLECGFTLFFMGDMMFECMGYCTPKVVFEFKRNFQIRFIVHMKVSIRVAVR